MDLPIMHLAFSMVKGLGAKTIRKIVPQMKDAKTQEDAYLLLEQLMQKSKRIEKTSRELFFSYVKDAEKILAEQEKDGVVAISMGDVAYPESFLKLDDPPVVFFAKGNVDALMQKGIAVIGTREVSDFGRQVGEHIGRYVAKSEFTVVSGLAAGCDTSGHRGCLDAGGITVAIVATPLNKVYPASNTALAKEILDKNGCFISEYPYGAPTSSFNFVARDRLQCGLANGVIVVETGLKGGTHHAVNGALKLGKPLACFNYKNEHYEKVDQSKGNRMLIQSGKADAIDTEDAMKAFLAKCGTVQKTNGGNSEDEMSLFPE